MGWEHGSERVAELVRMGELHYDAASLSLAGTSLDEARRRLQSSLSIADRDPTGGYVLTYEATGMGLIALLCARGLRATSRGGYVAAYEAAYAQFEPPFGLILGRFRSMHSRLIELESSMAAVLSMTSRDVREEVINARAIVFLAERLLPQLKPFAGTHSRAEASSADGL